MSQRILILGGGFGGVFTALALGGKPDVTLVSDEDHVVFAPMVYEYLSGEVQAWHIAPDYKELLDESVHFIKGAVAAIDLDRREVTIEGRPEKLSYDVLALAVGGVTNYWGVEGAAEFTLPFRKLAHANALRRRMTKALDHVQPDAAPQDARNAMTFAVVGGGASGVELATKMADLLQDAFRRRALRGEPRVLVIEMTDHVVPGMGDEIRKFVEQALFESRVEVHTQTRVARVTAGTITLEHNSARTEIETARVVWTAGVRMNPLVEKLAVEKNQRGLIVVEPTLQVRNHAEVFALGDIAFYKDVGPTLGGTVPLALQEAHLLGRNIRALIAGRELKAQSFIATCWTGSL